MQTMFSVFYNRVNTLYIVARMRLARACWLDVQMLEGCEEGYYVICDGVSLLGVRVCCRMNLLGKMCLVAITTTVQTCTNFDQ